MILKSTGIILLVISMICSAYADTGTVEENKKSIENFDNRLTIRPYFQASLLKLNVKRYEKVPTNITEQEEERYTDTITYEPNSLVNGGMRISYLGFGFSFTRTLDQSARDKEVYGETEYSDYQIYYYGRKFGVEVFYQKYEGFYLDDSDTFSLKKGDPETIRSDLSVATGGFNIFYVFSDNFSFKAAFSQLERQNAFDWSFLLMLSGIRFTINSDYSLIPENQESLYGDDAGFTGGTFTAVGISPGIGITKPFSNYCYITAALFLGTGYMHKRYDVAIGERVKHESFIKANIKLGAGYNGTTWFFGFSFLADESSSETIESGKGVGVVALVIVWEIFAGVRV